MRKTSRTSTKKRKIPENLSDLAAWLYTDLLLGLAVAFVGAGTFLAYNSNYKDPNLTTQIDPTYQLSCDEVVINVSSKIAADELDRQVLSEVNKAATEHSWTDPKAGLLLIYGGNGKTGSNTVGTNIAKTFRDQIITRSKDLLNVEKIVGGEGSLPTSAVRLKIFLVYKGLVADNGCDNP